ncbi:efflux RND transporter periplasmic adaptor subunit (plasmid) [Kovacikia minuta CCNUW1]|uniref:efflux RND transporter periplasmic adaptor subunit n=1 Tax=Kovacikia minuta TaxID=2931930 RepID=UPI001CCDCC97|nr:efflux RND transporter periplasmic adaptor subunit [Kovacikia minuta]UBF30035.1 efflux RND transporter periplasmic adaptor subunit [Kovacikia minuta CCNUW1]
MRFPHLHRDIGFNLSSIPIRREGGRIILLLGLTCLSACAASEAQSTKQAGEKRPVPVVAAIAKQQKMPILVRATGTAQAFSTVSVKSQVPGQLIGVFFREGQDVRQGDLLFKIDPRSLQAAYDQAVANRAKAVAQVSQAQAQVYQAQAQVKQAQANVAKDVAQAKNADVQAQRYATLLSSGAVSREQADQFQTAAESQRAVVTADQSNVGNAIAAVESAKANLQNAQASVRAADAEVDNARVQLSYTSIYAPNEGRLGKLNVNQGNLVKENDTTPLVTLSQIRPIYVEFSIPQRTLPDLRKYQARGQLQVEAKPPNDTGSPARGQLVFVDSGVDAATGTIKLRASFANEKGSLTPGEFVNVVLNLAQVPNAIVVPAPAVQSGQKGSFVYVIKPDHTVDLRLVKVGQTIANQTMIQSGVQAGDRVVVDGQFNLAPGAKVQEKTAGQTGAPQEKT